MSALSQRFWSKVRKAGPNECWPWLGSKTADGYGRFGYFANKRSRYVVATRVLMASLGHKVANKIVLHTCDNPVCCNPKHLRVGSHKDNIHDCMAKGRRASQSGERNNFAKLTEQDVREIRASNEKLAVLARRYNVTEAAISVTRSGKNWGHVK